MAPNDSTAVPLTPSAPATGGASPHTHVEVINPSHSLFGQIGRILKSDAHWLYVEFKRGEEFIEEKFRLGQAETKVVPAPQSETSSSPSSATDSTGATPVDGGAPAVPPVVVPLPAS